MMKSLLLAGIITLSHCAFSQDFLFVGTYAEKQAGKNYWCLDRNKFETTPLKEQKEFYTEKDKFYAKKPEWGSVHLFTPKSAAIIAEVEVKDFSFNCSYKTVWITYGNTPKLAEEELKNSLLKSTSAKDGKYSIVYTWDPKPRNLKEFNEYINGVQVIVASSATADGKKVLQSTFANKTDKTAVVALINSKGQVLHQPSVIRPGAMQKVSITTEEDFEIYLEFPKTPEEKPVSVIDRVKGWIKEKVTGKGKKFSPACMCIRG